VFRFLGGCKSLSTIDPQCYSWRRGAKLSHNRVLYYNPIEQQGSHSAAPENKVGGLWWYIIGIPISTCMNWEGNCTKQELQNKQKTHIMRNHWNNISRHAQLDSTKKGLVVPDCKTHRPTVHARNPSGEAMGAPCAETGKMATRLERKRPTDLVSRPVKV